MLTLTRKKYEIEELIRLEDENNNLLYEFTMQITADELMEIKRMLFSDAEKLKKEYERSSVSEKSKLEDLVDQKIKDNSERFEDICFKEHKNKFKKVAGEYKYNELVEEVMSFFINFFVEKKLEPYNTTITNLKNLTNKLTK